MHVLKLCGIIIYPTLFRLRAPLSVLSVQLCSQFLLEVLGASPGRQPHLHLSVFDCLQIVLLLDLRQFFGQINLFL